MIPLSSMSALSPTIPAEVMGMERLVLFKLMG